MKKYRNNVGIVVFNRKKQVLLFRRNDAPRDCLDAWQFPQGGMEEGETVAQTGLRELKEETSIVSAKLVFQTEESFCYDFPTERYGFAGQRQWWILCFFDGHDSEIDIKTAEPEFSDYKWTDFANAIDKVWSVKRNIYRKIEKIFSPIIAQYK